MGNKLFNSVKVSTPDSNTFDLTHDVKMTMDMGNLVPILNMEVIPGDEIKLSSESLTRLMPMLAPVYQRMDIYTHYFFVPNRLVWEPWEKFIVDASTTLVPPYINVTNDFTPAHQKFLDYLGIPPNTQPDINLFARVSAMPMAAYQCIYNEYYRDQNLVPEVNYKLTDGPNFQTEILTLRRRAWQHDYFTSALPWAQKGAGVDIPLGSIEANAAIKTTSPQNISLETQDGAYRQNVLSEPDGNFPQDSLYADMEGIPLAATTINDLRRAFKLQEWLEKNARGGTRYTESMKIHFGVNSPDARLQRPEYITGSQSPIVISEVLNTTGLTDASGIGLPQGNMSGHGIAVAGGNNGFYRATEHGFIIGIMSILPKAGYSQGIPKHFLKAHPLDYYWPSFANIGEQPIENQELYAYTANKLGVFGYTPRYAEYKFLQNRIAGDFRTSLDYWTLSRQFQNEPTLSKAFIECNSQDTKRIFAVTDPNQDSILVQVVNKITARRKMPVYGTPTF